MTAPRFQSLEASELTCVRGGRVVFRDVSFVLRAGRVLAVEGPNGSGKTSLLRVIAGFIAPERGSVKLSSKDGVGIDRDEQGRLIGWLGHKDGAKAQMTARETLRFFAGYCTQTTLPLREGRIAKQFGEGSSLDVRNNDPSPKNSSLRSNFSTLPQGEGGIKTVLDEVGLSRIADLPSQYLSAGQKKRLALARLKSSNRPLWLLDEPLAALDAAGRTLVTQMIEQHCATGGMALVATHEPLGLDCDVLQLWGNA